jgi:hypothetical protein
MCFSTNASLVSHPESVVKCPAKALGPQQRQVLSVHALAGTAPISELAEEAQVSRKFVYRQKAIAAEALDSAFDLGPDDDGVLFWLPVTKQWLRQFVIALVMIGHSSLRGVVELLRDLFDYPIALGTVHNILKKAVLPARQINDSQDLSGVRVGVHDEIFQKGRPVLAGVDALTTYCYLLSLEQYRDGNTWGVRLLELRDRGLTPDAFIGDAGSGMRVGLEEAFSDSDAPRRSDVFHMLQKDQEAVTALENRAYRAMNLCNELECKRDARRHRGLRTLSLSKRLRDAKPVQTAAIELADDIALLSRWIHHDLLALAGPCHAERLELSAFILAELKARVSQAPDIIKPLITYLENEGDNLLEFVAQLDRDFAALANAFDVAPELVRELFAVLTLDEKNPQRWHRDARLRKILGERYFPLTEQLEAVRRRTVRASSVVENINSRLRDYFFLRQMLGNDYLALLQFFLNHRRFLRSKHPERVDKSPTELLTGQPHPHWIELLGFTRFSRN